MVIVLLRILTVGANTVLVNHTVMIPLDDDIHNARYAVNNYHASFYVFQMKLQL